ncbi:MAG: transcription-repair coupling factor [Clostridiales bacterium]|nr:transcription-repair coupling factor [Clostridiales bacterium]
MAVTFHSPMEELVQFEELKKALTMGAGPLAVNGCVESQKTHLACELTNEIPLRLIVTYNENRAREIYEDAKCFHPQVFLYPAKDVLFYQADVQGNLLSRERMAILRQILEQGSGTVITTIDGCMDRIASPDEVNRRRLIMMPGDIVNMDELREKLQSLGYERVPQVEASGQFTIRGGILDVYPLTEENPVRVELWGDEIDTIRSFDSESQRSMENLDEIHIYAASETPESAESREALAVSLLDYFPEEAVFLLDEPSRLEEKAMAVSKEFQESMVMRMEKGYYSDEPVPELLSPEEVFDRMDRGRTILMSGLEQRCRIIREKGHYSILGKIIYSYENNFDGLIHDLKLWKKEGYRVALLTGSRTRAERLAGNLRDYELSAYYAEDANRTIHPGQILVTSGNIHKSFEYPQIKFAVVSEGDLFGKERKKRKKTSSYAGKRIQSFSELSVGDYVVHENHGLGIYQGIDKVEVGGTTRDYMKITYGDGGNLYIPVTQMNQVQKYAAADTDRAPKLNRLGGQEWNRTKSRVKKAVKNIAGDLVALYAKRRENQGFVYSEDTVWQREFEEQFPYEETEDQLKAIEAAKADMESTKIMDRLICGDVGYGKTEIAIRTAFKAIQDGKQVAYLVPTTILAQQHYNTFLQRMKDYPVEVDLLCRFRTAGEQKKTLERLKTGLVDVVIGTHRLLSKDVAFKDLGLLIIDEEQRFGVADKEKIKQLKDTVDVLSLTATPIPRTLHMSLIGIRDMSILEEPPMDRQPIQTYVMEYNDELVREAIQRELDRDGQVYYVYNKVKNIQEITNHIASLVPDANVVFAHGQMKERELEQIMLDFINGDIDVLVSTTIIETGLDISNTNTIIIHDADRYGLSQLYQLRGRVGRSSRSAYAFLMYRRDRMLKEIAEKRLQAIREYTEMGSGIKIAMRDLELRGAGNLLGAEQHGHMEAVGYDLYCKLLGEAVQEAKGEKKQEDFDTTVDMELDAYIPPSYIRNESQKMDIYKRIAAIETDEEYDDMQDELIDRFGEPPKAVQNLLKVSRLRALAHEVYVTELTGSKERIRIQMYEKAPVNPLQIPDFIKSYGGDLRLMPGKTPGFLYVDQRKRNLDTESTLECVKSLLNNIKLLLD